MGCDNTMDGCFTFKGAVTMLLILALMPLAWVYVKVSEIFESEK